MRLVARRDLERLAICRPLELTQREGDRLQLKANVNSTDNRKLANGEIVTVAAVNPDGSFDLADGCVMPPSFRQFARGYAVTSYGSQGKTVDHVIFADSCRVRSSSER
jgi:hypothetical protein